AREVMGEAGLAPGLMATGSSGYHVVARIEPEHDYAVVGRAARQLAGVMAARRPEEATTEFLKRDREGRVFVDWLRNRWAQSVVSPWSLRPRDGAPVAMPLDWEELDDTDPDGWRMAEAARRLRPDPWPAPTSLDPGLIDELASGHDVDVKEPFDRFGRNR
ncbi:MAG: hypothetical protein ACLFWM_10840, partial [Actinomycetota bacterium]